MKRVIASFLFLITACFTPVDDRWCGPNLPCTAGFVCTRDFHCIPSVGDGGSGGGAGGGSGGGTGGGSPQAHVGGPCSDSRPCASDDGKTFCIPESRSGMFVGWLGGYCTRRCDSQMVCPSDATCITETVGSSTSSSCYATCSDASPCRTGYRCRTQGMSNFCFPE